MPRAILVHNVEEMISGADRAILERREDLTPELIRVAVRTGIINMPRIPRGEVSDEQLDAIIRHLVKVKP